MGATSQPKDSLNIADRDFPNLIEARPMNGILMFMMFSFSEFLFLELSLDFQNLSKAESKNLDGYPLLTNNKHSFELVNFDSKIVHAGADVPSSIE